LTTLRRSESVDIRAVRSDDIDLCRQIFDSSHEDLHRRYGLDDDGATDPNWLRPVLTHFMETDPAGTVLANVGDDPIGFASSIRRDDYWFLSFLFVHRRRREAVSDEHCSRS
jgi:hypothetical protein